jgi:hypothetical protein
LASLCDRSEPPPAKQKLFEKAVMMKAAAGVFFQKYSGYADACPKLSLGDPARATPHIVYYTNKIVASAELQSALMAQHKEEAAQEAATAGAAPDNTPANAPAAVGPATAAAANPTTPRPSGGYMGRVGGVQGQDGGEAH